MTQDGIAWVSLITTIILGILAIILSILFYFMSQKQARDAENSAKDIANSVEKLEGLFSMLYTDTFSMMKETVTDMRKHIWRQNGDNNSDMEMEALMSKRVEAVKTELEHKIANIMKDEPQNPETVRLVVDETFSAVRGLETESVNKMVLSEILEAFMEHPAYEVVELYARVASMIPPPQLTRMLRYLKRHDIISYDCENKYLAGDTRVYTSVRQRGDIHSAKQSGWDQYLERVLYHYMEHCG